jgi:hypothetical protein
MKIILFILSLLLIPGVANATAMYKCAKNGHSSYQDKPCNPTSTQTKMKSTQKNSMIGCYIVKFSGFENSSSGTSERIEIRASTPPGYELQSRGVKMPLKLATPDELRQLSKGFHVHLSHGVSMNWPKGTPNQEPVGVYEGRGQDGKTLILAYFSMADGLATRVPCR